MRLTQAMEALLQPVAGVVASLAEAMAVAVVGAGAVQAFAALVVLAARRTRAPHDAWKAVWRRFGLSLVLGLEFALAADIVRSVVSPTWQDIGKLAAVAGVRTFLNYFLERDLERAHDTPRDRDLHHARRV